MLVKKGVYLISGPAKIQLVDGQVESIGKKFVNGEEIYIPEGKRIPIEVHTDSEMFISNKESFVELPSRTIPEDWDKVVELLIAEKFNVLLIFGEVDTGKTFFTTYLANKLLSKNVTPSVLDCDTGQSDIGPPSTLGLAVINKPTLFLTELQPTKLYFLGSHSPSEHFLYYIAGFVKLLNYGIKNSDIVIIDTPGWVYGDGARLLRNSEIEILSAVNTNYAVVLLQRDQEVEHLVKTVPQQRVIKLAVSKKATPTSPEERKKLREFVYKKYFKKLKNIEFKFDDILTDRVYFLTGTRLKKIKNKNILWIEQLAKDEGVYVVSKKLLTEKETDEIKKVYSVRKIKNVTKDEFQNIIVALLDEKYDVISLGIINDIDFVKQIIYISVPENVEVNNAKILQFGSLKLSLEIKEAGFVEPGRL